MPKIGFRRVHFSRHLYGLWRRPLVVLLFSLVGIPASWGEVTVSTEKPPSTIVIVCSTYHEAQYKSCNALREYARNPEKCPGTKQGLKVVGLDDPSPELLQRTLDGLPKHTPILFNLHGGMSGKRWPDTEPALFINPGTYSLVYPPGKGRFGKVKTTDKEWLAQGFPAEGDYVWWDDIKTAIKKSGKEPAIWLSTCHSENGCSKDICIGAACRKDAIAKPFWPAVSEVAGSEILDILCHPDKFQKLADQNGVISSEALERHFCARWGGNRIATKDLFLPASPKYAGLYRKEIPNGFLMPNIKLQPVRNEAAIQTEVDELRRKYPQKIVNVVRRVAAGISYADAKGNRHEFVPTDQIWYEPTLADLEAETRELAESDPKEFGGWPNDGTKMLKTAKVKIEGGGVAKDCRYFPLGHILSIEVRDAKGACYTDLSYEQRPVVNTFRLHSPYTH